MHRAWVPQVLRRCLLAATAVCLPRRYPPVACKDVRGWDEREDVVDDADIESVVAL